MIRLELRRMKYTETQTIGRMDVYRDSEYLFTLSTLERQWNNNASGDSCILPGFYMVVPHNSKQNPDTLRLLNTEPRTYILIHIFNYVKQSLGCVGVGFIHEDIDKDGHVDIKQSTDAMNKLRAVCQNQKTISINIKH